MVGYHKRTKNAKTNYELFRADLKFINAVKELNARMRIPNKVSGIQKKDIPALAKHAEKEANPLYPVPKLMTKNQLETLYYQIGE